MFYKRETIFYMKNAILALSKCNLKQRIEQFCAIFPDLFCGFCHPVNLSIRADIFQNGADNPSFISQHEDIMTILAL